MFRTPAILALLLVLCRATYAEDQPSFDGSIEELMANLNADSFQRRLEAQQQIATLSPEQIGVLVTLATTAPPEAAPVPPQRRELLLAGLQHLQVLRLHRLPVLLLVLFGDRLEQPHPVSTINSVHR